MMDTDEINKKLVDYLSNIPKEIGLNEDQIASIRRVGAIKGKIPVVMEIVSLGDKYIFFQNKDRLKINLQITLTNDYSKDGRELYKKLKDLISSL